MLSALQNKTYCTVCTHCSDSRYTESEISGFSTAHVYKYKTATKYEEKTEKITLG